MQYKAPWWLPGGHLQTIWAARMAHAENPLFPARYMRERWITPDKDYIDVDRSRQATSAARTDRPLLVLLHGLEGNSGSHYARAFASFAMQSGMDFAVPHFRGCSGTLNLAPRAYHSGDFAEVDWILRRLRAGHVGALYVVGVSLGGNALMRWAGEYGATAAAVVSAVVAVCAPLDLYAAGVALGRGFNRRVYTPMFLRSMKPRALQKLAQYPGLFDADALTEAADLYAFDNVFTAPLHGFKNTEDYWQRASAKRHLADIRVPALLINPLNDPFVPAGSLPGHNVNAAHVTVWQPRTGGHIGFVQGQWPRGHIAALPDAVGNWLAADH